MYKHSLMKLVAVFFSSLLCSPNQVIAQQEFSYSKTILPADTTQLWVTDGDATKEKVLILLQGGPKGSLNFVERGSTSSWRYLPNYENYFRVHLHQSSTYNPTMFEYEDAFSLEMAKAEVDNSSEMLLRAIQYFKARGKVVYVLGHSFGAFIIPHYLSTRPSLADKYIIISGRIDDDPIGIETHRQGFNGVYMDDGVRMVADDEEYLSDYSEAERKYYNVKQLLKWAIGVPKYSETLKAVDLSNVSYIYYPKDCRVGKLTSEEIAFLKSKKANVFSSNFEHGHTIFELVFLMRTGEIKL